jgi:GxxExxY protein
MAEPIYKAESFKIIGACMEVHRELGKGHCESLYKDALEIEFKRQGLASREQRFVVTYKGVPLSHDYFADFVAMDKIILEAKAIEGLTDAHVRQTLNHLAASRLKLGLLVNSGEDSLVYKRVVL